MKRISVLAAAMAALFIWSAQAENVKVDPSQVLHEISPSLYGIFLEDINCAVDGGLYAELIRNRSFEHESILQPRHADHWEAWKVQRDGGSADIVETDPLHPDNPHYLSVSLEDASGGVQITNQGFGGSLLRGGIPVEQGKHYDVSVWLRPGADMIGQGRMTIALTDAGGGSMSTEAAVDFSALTEGTWQKWTAVLDASDSGGANLTLSVSGKGTLDLDMVSLMPVERTGTQWPGGGMRTDLVEALADLHPRFLRFPGGCVVEGSYVRENAYDWKKSVGPVEERREIGNTWGGMQTMGVGFYEYFCLAEYLHALPVPVVHAGVLCQARETQDPPLTMQEMEVYAQDVLDLIEFAKGSADTVWGGLRADMGHPEPFDLRYIAIGNENWGPAYFSRYALVREKVREAWPEITCIVAAGPVAEGGLIRDSWNTIRSRFADDLVDEHYYMESSWFPSHTSRYDHYPRTTRVFLGEYAAHEPVQGSRRPSNLYAALCEAAYLTGIERNSDLIELCCYAPLLCREGAVDWTPDLIYFDEARLYLSPSYHVQRMFSSALGQELVESETDGSLFHTASRSGGEVQVKLVNLSEETIPVTLKMPGVPDQTAQAEILSSGKKTDVNSFARPDKVMPQNMEISLEAESSVFEMQPWSLMILRIQCDLE